MTKKEMIKAERLLRPYADRLERSGIDGGGWCLTAYWLDGGQTLFYALDAAQARADEIGRK